MISQVNVCILSINARKWNSLIKTLGRYFFSSNIFLYEFTDGNVAVVPSLKNILYFPWVRVFHFLTLCISPPFYFSIFDCFLEPSSYLSIESLLCTLSFTGLRCIYKPIPVYIQILAPGWAHSCLKKTRHIHMKMSVNRTSQCVIQPIAGPWWMFTNDDSGTKLSGTGQERSIQGCPAACVKQSQK